MKNCPMLCYLPVTNSYEEVAENPMVEDETSSLQKPVISNPPETRINFQDNNSVSESYDDVDRPQSGEIE